MEHLVPAVTDPPLLAAWIDWSMALHWSCLAGTEQGHSKLVAYLSLSMNGLEIVPLLQGVSVWTLAGVGGHCCFHRPAVWACINSGKGLGMEGLYGAKYPALTQRRKRHLAPGVMFTPKVYGKFLFPFLTSHSCAICQPALSQSCHGTQSGYFGSCRRENWGGFSR